MNEWQVVLVSRNDCLEIHLDTKDPRIHATALGLHCKHI